MSDTRITKAAPSSRELEVSDIYCFAGYVYSSRLSLLTEELTMINTHNCFFFIPCHSMHLNKACAGLLAVQLQLKVLHNIN